MRTAIALPLTSYLLMCVPALGQTFWMSGIDAQAETETGAVWTIDPEDIALNTARFSSGLQRRAVLEYPIDFIPEGVIVRSASIEFEVAGLTHSGDEFPIIEFHGYAGDGVLSVDDAQQPPNPIGRSDIITAPGEKPVVTLDAAYVQ